MLITVVLLLFKLEGIKELNEEVKSRWSALRVLTDNMPILICVTQMTDLFYNTIPSAKCNMLTSFNTVL